MAITNTRAAFVNRSSVNIPIAKDLVDSNMHTGGLTTGSETIGKIYPGECYTIIPNFSNNITSFKVVCRNSAGKRATGYIETSPGINASVDEYSWVKYQEPYHYYNSNGSSLVSSARENIGGVTHYIFTVKKAVAYCDPQGNSLGTLAVGTKLAARGSTTGQTKGHYMQFYKKKVGTSWVNLCSSGYGFVDLGFDVGSKPNNRAIY